MTSTACDDQWVMDRDAAIDELARTVAPMEWKGGGHMRHAGHTISWGEYCMRRHELEEGEQQPVLGREDMLTHLAKTLRDWPRDYIECEATEPGHGWCWFDVPPDCESVLGVPGRDGIDWTITEKEWEAACWAEGEARIDRIAQSDASGAHYDEAPSKYHVRLNGKWCDVYDVLQAFGVTNPADAHAIKKMLMPGKRGHKGGVQDREEAIQSLRRAIELEAGQ